MPLLFQTIVSFTVFHSKIIFFRLWKSEIVFFRLSLITCWIFRPSSLYSLKQLLKFEWIPFFLWFPLFLLYINFLSIFIFMSAGNKYISWLAEGRQINTLKTHNFLLICIKSTNLLILAGWLADHLYLLRLNNWIVLIIFICLLISQPNHTPPHHYLCDGVV